MKKLILSLICIVFLSNCVKEEFLLVPPQLKIIVRNLSGDLVNGATISLYESRTDYLADSNLVVAKQTSIEGSYIFKDLKEIIYHFNVSKDSLSNYEDITFFKDSLKMGERKVIYTVIR